MHAAKTILFLETVLSEGLQSALADLDDQLARGQAEEAHASTVALWPHLQWMDNRGLQIMKAGYNCVLKCSSGDQSVALHAVGGKRADLAYFQQAAA